MKKSRHLIILVFLSLMLNTTQAMGESTVYGFVRSDFFAQSRQTKASVLDLFPLFPMPVTMNEDNTQDLSNMASAGLSSVTTRIGIHFNAPGIWGANRSYSRIETDLSGGADFFFLRLRQAYSQLFWEHSDLIIGQTWHPLFSLSVMPNVISINTGAPYIPFNRSPQVRYTYTLGHTKIYGAAVYQVMYKTIGPSGASIQYQKDAMIPNMFLGIEYSNNGFTTGVGADYKSIRPEKTISRISTTTLTQTNYINKSLLNTYAATAYASYKKGLFKTSAKAVYGQNLSEHSIIGGFAIGPNHEYVAYNSVASFATLSYGKTHLVDLFGGYSANLGANTPINDSYNFYGFGQIGNQVIRDMYRLSASYTYNPENWRIGLEVDYSNAAWGKISNGEVQNAIRSEALRVNAVIMYLF